MSYFPNWHVSGAKGPYRVTPNLMVVIPTSHHVRLHYGYTSIDIVAMLISLIGIAGVVWLFRAKPVHMPSPLHLARARGGPRPETEPAPAPFYRLEHELAGAFPPTVTDQASEHTDQDLDVWLGFPAGLDLARYRTSDYGQAGRYGNGADVSATHDDAPVTGEVPVVDASGAPASGGRAPVAAPPGEPVGRSRRRWPRRRWPSRRRVSPPVAESPVARASGGRAAVAESPVAESPVDEAPVAESPVDGAAPSAEPTPPTAVEPANGDDAAVPPSEAVASAAGAAPDDVGHRHRPPSVIGPVVTTPPAETGAVAQALWRDTEEVRAAAAPLSRTVTGSG